MGFVQLAHHHLGHVSRPILATDRWNLNLMVTHPFRYKHLA